MASTDTEDALYMSALRLTLQSEGTAFVNNPMDHGGPTRYGVTLATLAHYRGKPVGADDVANLTLDEAVAVYRAYYWQPMRMLYRGTDGAVAAALFDTAVLCGSGRMVTCCQVACGLEPDGVAGPMTHTAMQQPPPKFLAAYVSALLDYFMVMVARQPAQVVFLRGWVARAMRYITAAIPA